MKHESVRNWMTSKLVTIAPENTLPEAHQLMVKHQIRRLPVVAEDGRLVGIITLGDVRGAEPSQATSLSVWELNYLLSTLKVSSIMTPNPITISADATVVQAARVMLEHKVSGLPVVEQNGRLAGIITESDIFRMVVRHEWEEKALT
jgi:acetoin utilization protein AcuB